MKPFFPLLIILFLSVSMFAQESHSYEHDHDDHHHSFREIGMGAGLVYILGEQEWAPGMHLHFVQAFGEHRRFSLAPGLEFVFDEHRHTVFSLGLGYRPVHRFYLGLAPGISLKSGGETEPSLHLEAMYELGGEHFHLGPLLEFGMGPDDRHLMLGVHLGIPF